MIILDKVVKKYQTNVVNKLSLNITRGDFFGLIGPNGAGKTTTIKMLTALTEATSGSISINGIKVSRNSTNYKAQFGVAPQRINLEPELTVLENLKLHGKLYQMDKKKIENKINELLTFVNMTENKNYLVNKLSEGMKRKIVIIRALMHEPSILFLDEPTVGLDVYSRKKVWNILKQLNQQGITIILTTHYLEEAESLCNKIALLQKGELIMSGNMEELRHKTGRVVVEELQNNQLNFFTNKKEAYIFASECKTETKVRNTTLEDVFVKLMGNREAE